MGTDLSRGKNPLNILLPIFIQFTAAGIYANSSTAMKWRWWWSREQMSDAGKAGQSRVAFGTGACLCWFKVYVNNRLCVPLGVLFYLIGAVAERGDPTPVLLSAGLFAPLQGGCGCRVSCQCADLINVFLSVCFSSLNWWTDSMQPVVAWSLGLMSDGEMEMCGWDEGEAAILVAACAHCWLSINETTFSFSIQSPEPQAIGCLVCKNPAADWGLLKLVMFLCFNKIV